LRNFQEKGMIVDMPIDSVFRLIATNIAGYILFAEILYRPEAEGYSDQEVELKRTIEFIARGLRPKTKTKEKPVLKPRAKKKSPVPAAAKVKKKKKS
ncbi:TetR/AcrR family transcriptional regulator, partial [Leptospira borgpetersenii serovar Tarassovi]|nr:TetR/AcrR family transcriptional regulator [Leptospira borgpetersenii serovar Tarassovi]